jgi:hypothetical protein
MELGREKIDKNKNKFKCIHFITTFEFEYGYKYPYFYFRGYGYKIIHISFLYFDAYVFIQTHW